MKTKVRKKRSHHRPTRPAPRPRPDGEPILRFTPTAWAKLHFFCHFEEAEIGGFGVTGPDDLLMVEDFVTVKQVVSPVSVCFDDRAVADFFDQQVDAGRKPEQFGRIWLHTHPAHSAVPSGTDEETFSRVFGGCQWAVMFVLSRSGETHARLRFNVGPKAEARIPVEVDYGQPFSGSDHATWGREYEQNVRMDEEFAARDIESGRWEEWLDEFEDIEATGGDVGRADGDDVGEVPSWEETEVSQ